MITPLLETPQAGGYRVIYADPPWNYRTYTLTSSTRSARRHYPTMAIEDIKALPVRKAAARDCHLFLWTTWPHLVQALDVMSAWGFRYSSNAFTWVKLRRQAADVMFMTRDDFPMLLGRTTRKNTELCLLGRRGSPRRLAGDIPELVISPLRQHSRKPDEIRDLIRRYAEGPYLEMFSRSSAPGWDAWGLEVGKFDEHQAQAAPSATSALASSG